MKTALFIRLDRMGDLVLSLPCDHLVADEYKAHWFIPKGLEFVAQSAKPKKEFTSFTNQGSWSHFLSLRKKIKEIKPDVSVSFHVPWWVNLALWSCGVKTRGGVLSQWHSYLFLNKGLRQKRSQVQFHEMEYNYLLVEHVFDLKSDPKHWLPMELTAENSENLQFDTKQNYFVVHPGMGGSALNWPTGSYSQLIELLSEKATIVVTGTKGDDLYLSPLKKSLKDNHKVVWLDKQLNGYQLLKLLHNAKANIAPSTGVLHLSASLGAASIGIFSPIKVHQDKRWGPKGSQTFTFAPEVQCPAQFDCLMEDCSQYFCMTQINVASVAEKALSFL